MRPRVRLALATVAVLALAFPATARVITPTDAAFTDQVDALGELTADVWPTSGYARGTAGNTVFSGTSVNGSTSFRDEDPPGQSTAGGGFSNTGLLFSLNGNASTCAAYTVGTSGPHSNCATPPPSDTDATSTLNSYNFSLALVGLSIDNMIRLSSPIITRTTCALDPAGSTTTAPAGTVQLRRTLAGSYNSYPMPGPGAPTTFNFNYLGALGLAVANIRGEVETTTHLDTTNGVAVSEARLYVEVRAVLGLAVLATVDTVLGRSECSLAGPVPAAIAMRSKPAETDAALAEPQAIEAQELEEELQDEPLAPEDEEAASTEVDSEASPDVATGEDTTITETSIPTTTSVPAPTTTTAPTSTPPTSAPPAAPSAEPTTTIAPAPTEPATSAPPAQESTARETTSGAPAPTVEPAPGPTTTATTTTAEPTTSASSE
ncbi:hypothetical protein [Lolliginicoccus levis]|uniref:hypothetical protein n=1 Tax=Lolliginicoccus levis TaxID=2919542 RepID=UPI00241E2083|nr:hypothetical protein [Lolliginicoccus levis]